jgi:hypothetical protein
VARRRNLEVVAGESGRATVKVVKWQLFRNVYKFARMQELTQLQMETLERLFIAGFRPIAIPPYENAMCVHRGECAALLAPVENGGLKLLAPVTVLVEGNLSVRLRKPAGDVFVWKKKEVAATKERLQELERFRGELVEILEMTGRQRGDWPQRHGAHRERS